MAKTVSHANPVVTQARWNSPPWFTSEGTWLNAALASPKLAATRGSDAPGPRIRRGLRRQFDALIEAADAALLTGHAG